MDWITFNPGSEPCVLTADLCAIYGCDKCPGYAAVRDLPGGRMRDTGDAPVDPDATVLCVHTCHRLPQQELASEAQGITVTCPKCGGTNSFPGFAMVEVFACGRCGEMVEVGGGPVQ